MQTMASVRGRRRPTTVWRGMLPFALLAAVVAWTAGAGTARAASLALTLQGSATSVTFPNLASKGEISAGNAGYVAVNPGFSFVSGTATTGFATTDVVLGTDSSGHPTLAGTLSTVPASGGTVAPPTQQTVAVGPGSTLLIQDSAGAYVLLRVLSATATDVTFVYAVGTTSPAGSTTTTASTGSGTGGTGSAAGAPHPPSSATVAGRRIAFSSHLLTGTVAAESGGMIAVVPGFDLVSGTPAGSGGTHPDLILGSDRAGRPTLSGFVAPLLHGSVARPPVEAAVPATAGETLLVLDHTGAYVSLVVTAATPGAVRFVYARQTGAPPAPVLPRSVTIGTTTVSFPAQTRSARVETWLALTSGRAVTAGQAAADLIFSTDASGEPALTGNLALLGPGSPRVAGLASGATVEALPGTVFVVRTDSGRIAVVGVTAATPQMAVVVYRLTASPVVLRAPAACIAAGTRLPGRPAGPGLLLFAAFSRTGVVFAPAASGPGSPPAMAMQLLPVLFFQPGSGGPAPARSLVLDQHPRLSPDGQALALYAPGSFTVERADGRKTILHVSNGTLGAVAAAWSPDGRLLAYEGGGAEGGYAWADGSLYVVNTFDGTTCTVVDRGRGPQDVLAVQWLPTGGLVFSASDGHFYAVDPGLDRVLRLPVDTGAGLGDGGRFDLSPDGRRIAWVGPGAYGKDQVWLSGLDGSGRRELTANRFDALSPQFSPDGRLVAYVGLTGPAGGELWLVGADGRSNAPMTTDAGDRLILVDRLEQWLALPAPPSWW